MAENKRKIQALLDAGTELLATEQVNEVVTTFQALGGHESTLEVVRGTLTQLVYGKLSNADVDCLFEKLRRDGFQGLDIFEYAKEYGLSERVLANAAGRLVHPKPSFVQAMSQEEREAAGVGADAGHKTFSGSLLHQFPVVSRQVENGLYAVKRAAAYLKKLCQFEEVYSKDILKATNHEVTKLDRTQGDGMRNYVNTWIGIQEVVYQTATQHQEFRAKVMSAVVLPLQAFYKEAEGKRKEILQEMTALAKQMNTVSDQVKKSKKKAMQLLSDLKASKDRDMGVEPAAKAQGKGGMLSKLTRKLKEATADSTDVLEKKAIDACNAYEEALQTSNKRRKTFRERELPHIFDQLNQLEVARLDVLKEHLTKFSLILHELVSPLEELSTRVVRSVAAMDADEDIDQFIDSWVAVHGESPPFAPAKYDLPTDAAELRSHAWDGSLELKTNHNSIFGTTLTQVMELQRDKFPDARTPVILTTLIRAIRENGGTETEGIFRISASRSEQMELKKNFDNGIYDVPGSSPHLPAGLLKMWLRELSEPLVPAEMYDECIHAGQQEEVQVDVVMDIYSRLPQLTRDVIEELVGLLAEIVRNSERNLMSPGNIAIVFSPSVLRCESDNPLQMMLNSKHETKFVHALLEQLIERA